MIFSSFRLFFILAFSAASLFSTISYANAPQVQVNESAAIASQNSPLTAELLNEEESIQPGKSFWVAINLNLEDKWHAYWKNPGDIGMPTSVEWQLPEGFHASAIEWPYPQRFVSDLALGFGYEKEAILLAEITPPNTLTAGKSIEIKANLKWVICSDSACIPGKSDVTLSLPVSAEKPKVSTRTITQFAKAREKLPKKKWNIEAFQKDGLIELSVKAPSTQPAPIIDAYFCPEETDLVNHKVEALFAPFPNSKNQYTMTLKLTEDSQARSLKGVLVLLTSEYPIQTIEALEVDLPVTPASNREVAMLEGKTSVSRLASIPKIPLARIPDVEFEGGVGFALFLAFVGGMILNLMPCVLPVISFKILSFVKIAGDSRSRILKHGLAFSFGVLISFWALAGALLLLQSYGRTVGWGFQLQEPIFVAILAAILFVFGLSLFGILEIGISVTQWVGNVQNKHSQSGLFGSFLSGILATAVATPCTGPFLGSAVGFAVTLPAFWSMLIFTSLGLGMAFPYLLLSAYPKLIRYLPKPGDWMMTFKELMGFFMLATVLWLLWVFGAQTNTLAIFILLCGLFFLAIGCWIYGRWGTPINNRLTRFFGFLFAFAALSVAGYAIVTSTASWVVEQTEHYLPKASKGNPGDLTWEEFSPERVAELQSKGVPVFIDFTAKWCLICQANHMVLSTDEVEQKIKELGVVRMKADWTKNDPVITQELRKFGRNGVPLYVFYGSDRTQSPKILPQVLTPDVVVNHLQELDTDIALE